MSDDRIERLRREILADRAELERLHLEADRQWESFCDVLWIIVPIAFACGASIAAIVWVNR